MADGDRIGLGAALGAIDPAPAGAPSLLPAEAQGDLLDLNGPEGAEGPLTAALEQRARGPGRPRGSPNKKTEDLRRFVLARFKHPVVAAAELYSMPATSLAAILDCDPLEAATLQLKAMAFVGPYVDSTMPARMQIDADPRLPEFSISFTGPDGSAVAVDASGKRLDIVALAARAKAAMDQRLIEGEANKSHGDASHGEAKGEGKQGLDTF